MNFQSNQLISQKKIFNIFDSELFILFLWCASFFLSPLHHDLARYSFSTSLVWNDLGWIFFIPIIFSLFNSRVRSKIIGSKKNVHIFLGFLLCFLFAITFATTFSTNYASLFRWVLFLITPLFLRPIIRIYPLLFSLCLIGILSLHSQWAVLQFIIQHDIGMNILGESTISPGIPGIAKFLFGSTKLVRAYGPYQHSNILAGSLLLGYFLSMFFFLKKKLSSTIFLYSTSLLLLLGITLSFSRTSLIGFILLLLVSIIHVLKKRKVADKKKMLSYVLLPVIILGLLCPLLLFRNTDIQDTAASSRLRGYTWAIEIIKEKTLLHGVGIGNYPLILEKHLLSNEVSHEEWEAEPVHNTFLLLISEWGMLQALILLALILFVISREAQKSFLPHMFLLGITILPAFLLDHYFVTSTQSLILLELIVLLLLEKPDLE